MSRWAPAGLPRQLLDLARAIDAQFAPLRPVRPPRLPAYELAELTDAFAADNPNGLAIDATSGRLVISRLVAGVWRWRRYDGSPL